MGNISSDIAAINCGPAMASPRGALLSNKALQAAIPEAEPSRVEKLWSHLEQIYQTQVVNTGNHLNSSTYPLKIKSFTLPCIADVSTDGSVIPSSLKIRNDCIDRIRRLLGLAIRPVAVLEGYYDLKDILNSDEGTGSSNAADLTTTIEKFERELAQSVYDKSMGSAKHVKFNGLLEVRLQPFGSDIEPVEVKCLRIQNKSTGRYKYYFYTGLTVEEEAIHKAALQRALENPLDFKRTKILSFERMAEPSVKVASVLSK